MADNSSIAFQIYQNVKKRQIELEEKKTIKSEDFQEFSEESFINDLQASVNFYAKDIKHNNIISGIYIEILKQVDRISDFSQFFTKSGIKIPEEVIVESIKLATEKSKDDFSGEEIEKEDNFLDEFNNIENLEDKIKFYEELSEEQQEKVRKEVYSSLFGEEVADEIISQEKMAELEESEYYKNLTPEQQEHVNMTRESNNILKNIVENFGLDFENLKKSGGIWAITLVANRLRDILESSDEIDEKTYDLVLETLTKRLNFSKDEADKFIGKFEEKYRKDPNFYLNMEEYKEHQKKANVSYAKDKEKLSSFFIEEKQPYIKELESLIVRSYDSDGKLDVDTLMINIEDLYNRGGLPPNFFSFDQNKLKNMNLMGDKLKNLLKFDRDSMKYEKISNDNDFVNQMEKDEAFSEFIELNNSQKDKYLLSDFSTSRMTDDMKDLFSDTFGPDVEKMMILRKNDFHKLSKIEKQGISEDGKGKKTIEEPSVDFLYSMRSEDLIMKQVPKIEEKPKAPIDIVPETLEFNLGANPIQTANDEKRSSAAKIEDIKRLIEKQGHQDDIVATIAKISEIGKKGIDPVEQGKNVEGEILNDQNSETPSDEEKE